MARTPPGVQWISTRYSGFRHFSQFDLIIFDEKVNWKLQQRIQKCHETIVGMCKRKSCFWKTLSVGGGRDDGHFAVGDNKFRYAEYSFEIPKRVRNDTAQRTFWSAPQFCLIIFDENRIENCNMGFKNALKRLWIYKRKSCFWKPRSVGGGRDDGHLARGRKA